jgi:hypothetical protein
MIRYAHRIDGNHNEIVAALEAVGVGVIDTSAFGEFVDLTTLHRGTVRLIEVKNGSKPASARKLTLAQLRLHEKARQHGVTIHVVKSVEEALAVHGARIAA